MSKDTMIGKARLAALAVLVGLLLLIGLGISSPGLSSADQHTTTTTAAPATTTTAAPATTTTAAPATTTTAAPTTTTTAAPATTTTAAPATTTTAAPATTTTAARSTSTTAPTSATTAPGSPPSAGAGLTGSVSEPGAETPAKVGGTTVSRAPSRLISEPAPNRPTTKEFRQERRLAPPPEPSDVGPQQNLAPLFEPERVRPPAGEPERAGLATKPLATGGLVLGAVAGLLLGLADRAAGLSARSR